jgi:hypothetical protein
VRRWQWASGLCVVAVLVGCGASGGGDDASNADAARADVDRDAHATDAPRDATADDSTHVPVDAPVDATTDAMPSCPPLSGAHYDWVGVTTAPSPTPSEVHPDINLLLRTWRPASGQTKGLVTISHPVDPVGPPHLDTLFSTPRIPAFPNVYQAQSWDWGCHCFTGYISDPPVTIVGMETTEGEILQVPKSGYTIDPPDFAAMVLWAAPNTLTLKYDTGDNIGVPNGYAIMMAGVCVDPQLVTSYRDAVSSTGRTKLPGLHRGQAFAYAAGAEIQVAVRDSGSWMDPRWCNDWWPSCP